MKFDLYSWQEIETANKYKTDKGRIHIKASKEVALFASAQGVEVLVGVGTDIRVEFAETVEYWVEGPSKTRVFTHAPGKTFHRPVGEVYTNADRMPDESGAVLEVKKALRELKLQQREMRREMAEERRALRKPKPDEAEPEPAEETAEPVETDPAPDEVKETESKK